MKLLPPSPELTPEEVERGLSNILYDGLTTHAFVTLTSGIFLIAFALELGASNIVIGLLAALGGHAVFARCRPRFTDHL
mgnify:CR=1 FL=1